MSALDRDRHIPDGNFLDEESLKKLIVDLKSQQLSLAADHELLEQEVSCAARLRLSVIARGQNIVRPEDFYPLLNQK